MNPSLVSGASSVSSEAGSSSGYSSGGYCADAIKVEMSLAALVFGVLAIVFY